MTVMNAKDTISASLAECFITVNGNRYNFMQATKLEASFTREKVDVPRLGTTIKGHKSAGGSGAGSATFYYTTSMFRELLLEYKNTGEDFYFDIQVTNEDATSSIGRQTVILKDCNIDGGILAKFGANGEILEEDLSFTFDDWEMPEKFNLLQGMR